MKIEKVITQWVRVPLPRPVGFSIKTLSHRDYLIVRVRSDAGIEGIGMTLNDATASPAKAAVDELLAPRIVGRDPRDITGLWELLYRQTVREGRKGNTIFGLSALDIALWDHHGKLMGQPLYKLLGAYRSQVPCYASGGYYYDGDDGLELLAKEIQGYMDAGFQAVKIKIGRLPLRQEEERVRLVRSLIGPDKQLFVDANQAWHDVNDVVAIAKMLARYDVGWIEEPFPPDMHEHFRRLKPQIHIPIATGEVAATRWEFSRLVDTGGVDILQHDATVCGGISEWLRITDMCSARGISVAPHYFWDIHVHLAAARREVTWVEYFVGTDVVNFDLLWEAPLKAEKGMLTPPSGPGLGLTLNEQAVARYLHDETEVTL